MESLKITEETLLNHGFKSVAEWNEGDDSVFFMPHVQSGFILFQKKINGDKQRNLREDGVETEDQLKSFMVKVNCDNLVHYLNIPSPNIWQEVNKSRTCKNCYPQYQHLYTQINQSDNENINSNINRR